MLDTAHAEAAVSVRLWPIADLTPNPRNARTHPADQVDAIAEAMKEFGWTNPMLVDLDDDGIIVAGHGRRLAALKLIAADEPIRLPNGRVLPKGYVPVIDCGGWSEEQRRAYTLADNRLAETSSWDDDLLRVELSFLKDNGFALDLTGFDAKSLEKIFAEPAPGTDPAAARRTLAERFGVPPFSVLNAREGWWQDRKRAWVALGIQSELGRGDSASPSGSPRPATDYSNKERGDGRGRAKKGKPKGKTFMTGAALGGGNFNDQVFSKKDISPAGLTLGEIAMDGPPASGTSIFDPVLTELAYRWFCPPGGTILDPFAGGSVRGIVASELGRLYVGVDLRAEQIEANRVQAETIGGDPLPVWHVGDSRDIGKHAAGVEADFVFSCPPYADLEVYSDDPADLSTLAYAEFRKAYAEIIAASCAMLKPDRFAAFVVGEVRDKKGNYYGFVPDTIRAFEAAGLRFYNEAILVTAAGSLPIRVGKQFDATRKIGKTHQNVLVFIKGDAKKATEAIGECEFGEIEAPADGG